MTSEMFGWLSASIVGLGALPYLWRVWEKKITPNITSWSLWSIIGGLVLLTYDSAGAKANVWPAMFGFINPVVITLAAIKQKSVWEKLTRIEYLCIALCVTTLIVWWFVRSNAETAQYALYLAIIADGCAVVPTIFYYWRDPGADRPTWWLVYGVGYGIAVFAITDHTFANYVLPIYMLLGATIVFTILSAYRIKNRAPIKEWV